MSLRVDGREVDTLAEGLQPAAPLDAPFIEWPEFKAEHFVWNQDEHVTLLGATGQGKTTLALDIIERRRYPVIFATKPEDEVLEQFIRENDYKVVRRWHERPVGFSRLVLWPDIRRMDKMTAQKQEFVRAIAEIYSSGRRCAYFDELGYMCEDLHLTPLIKILLKQGRGMKCAVFSGSQEPIFLPYAAYNQATHLFIFRESDEKRIKRLSEISGDVDKRALMALVRSLPQHQCAYVNTRTGEVLRTQVAA